MVFHLVAKLRWLESVATSKGAGPAKPYCDAATGNRCRELAMVRRGTSPTPKTDAAKGPCATAVRARAKHMAASAYSTQLGKAVRALTHAKRAADMVPPPTYDACARPVDVLNHRALRARTRGTRTLPS